MNTPRRGQTSWSKEEFRALVKQGFDQGSRKANKYLLPDELAEIQKAMAETPSDYDQDKFKKDYAEAEEFLAKYERSRKQFRIRVIRQAAFWLFFPITVPVWLVRKLFGLT